MSLAALLLAPAGGCLYYRHEVKGDDPDYAAKLDEASKKLDKAQNHLAKWGHAGIGGAALVPPAKDQFAFDPEITDADLFAAQRLDGRSLDVLRKSLRLRAVASGAENPLEIPDQEATKDNAAVEDVTGGEALTLAEGELRAGLRHRIRLAASDRFEIGLHKTLSDFNAPGVSSGYLVFNAHCFPGWRTGHGEYAARVNARLALNLDTLDTFISKWDGLFEAEFGNVVGDAAAVQDRIAVVAVYPAFDTQELDVRAAREELVAIATELAVAGKVAEGKLFLDAAEKLESQGQTRSSFNRVSSFTTGRQFGYVFKPTWEANVRPGSKVKPGYRLDNTSFPAVAVIALDLKNLMGERVIREAALRMAAVATAGDIEVEPDSFVQETFLKQVDEKAESTASFKERVQAKRAAIEAALDGDGSATQADRDAFTKARDVVIAMLRLEVTHQSEWLSLGLDGSWKLPSQLGRAQDNPVNRTTVALRIEEAAEAISGSPSTRPAGKDLADRIAITRERLLGSRTVFPITALTNPTPEKKPTPKLAGVTGMKLTADDSGKLHGYLDLSVADLPEDITPSLAGDEGVVEVISRTKTQLVLAVKSLEVPAAGVETIKVGVRFGNESLALPLLIDARPTPRLVEVDRQDGRVTRVALPDGVTPEQLAEILRAEQPREGDVEVDVDVTASE